MIREVMGVFFNIEQAHSLSGFFQKGGVTVMDYFNPELLHPFTFHVHNLR